MVRHQIGILRFSGGVRNQIWKLLDATERDLRIEIERRAGGAGFRTAAKRERLRLMLSRLRESRLSGWREVRKTWFAEMRDLAVAEAGFFDRIIAAAIPVQLGSVIPEASALRNNRPVHSPHTPMT